MKNRQVFIASFIVAMTSHSLHANNHTPMITVSDEIVVTATRSEQAGIVTPTSITVISAEDIALTGVSSLTDVLRSQAGIQIKDNVGNGSRASVSMRGFGSNNVNNVLIVVDGRKLNNPTLAAPLLSSVALKDVERIEILQGSGGVLFGDQAVGGVINIITKRPGEQQFYVDAGVGSDNLRMTTFSASQGFDNGIAYRLSGERKKADNYRDNNDQDYRNLFGLVSYEAERGTIFYERHDIDDELALPGSLTDAQIDENRRQTVNSGDFSNQAVIVDRFGFSYHLSEQVTFDTNYSIRNSDGDSLISFGNVVTPIKQETRLKTLGARLLGDWDTQRGKWLLTLGYEDINGDHQNDAFGETDWEQDQQSFYGQAVIPVREDIDLAIGARKTHIKDSDLINGTKNDDTENATEIGLSYDLSSSTQLFMRRATSFRFANIDENGFTLPPTPPESVVFLDPQTSTSIEAGYEYNTARFALKIVGYTMDIEDELYYDINAFANVNLDSSNRRGIIVEGHYDLTSSFSISGSYSQTEATYKAGSFEGNDVPFVPEQTAVFGLNYALTSTVNVYADAIYTGRRFRADDDNNASDQLGGYTLYNINLGYNTNPAWQDAGWSANLRVNNVFGKAYSGLLFDNGFSSGGYPAPETTIAVNLGYHF